MRLMVLIKYLGHAGFEISFGDIKFLIDPFSGDMINGEKRLTENFFEPSLVRSADAILVTHEHPAHCDAPAVKEVAERTYAHVIAPRPCLALIGVSDRLKIDVRTGDKFNVKGVDIEVVKSVHPQSVYPVGYILGKDGMRVYHAGDTYQYVGMAGNKCDVALLPIGGVYTMDPFAAASACNEIRPKYVIPMHYNTHARIEQDAREFTDDVRNGKPVVLKPGQSVNLNRQ